MRTARGSTASARARPRTSCGAGSRAGRTARSSSLDDLQIDVLEARRDDADAVDRLALGDELADEPGHVVAACVGEAPRPGRDFDLDAALPAQLVGRPSRDDAPVVDDHDVIAHE